MYYVIKKECRTDELKHILDMQFPSQFSRIVDILESLTSYGIDIEEVAERFNKEFPDYLDNYIESRKEVKRKYVDK